MGRTRPIIRSMQTEVIIIGAGPTGLALACQYVRYGVDFIIIEKKEGVTPYSKAYCFALTITSH